MDADKIAAVIREELSRRGTTPYRASLNAGMPGNAIRYVLEKRATKSDRLAEICRALGLEFYIGPPRDHFSTAQPSTSIAPGDLERPVQDLTRMVVATGGNPIPDDLWPLILERRNSANKAIADNEDRPEVGVRVLDSNASEDLDEPGPGEVIVPFARDIQAAAGAGSWADDDGEQMRVAVPRSFIPGWASPGSLSCIRARGDSMEPALNDGDLILMDRSHIDPVDGEVFVIHSQDGLVVKRVRKIRGGWQMTSDNPAYKQRPLEEWDHNVGRVAWSGPLPATEAGD